MKKKLSVKVIVSLILSAVFTFPEESTNGLYMVTNYAEKMYKKS